MNSDACRKPPLGTFKFISNPNQNGCGEQDRGILLQGLYLLVVDDGSWAASVASYHRGLAKGDEATHSPRSWETKESRKLLAPLKRLRVILSSRRVSQEKGITRATQGKKEVGSRLRGGAREGCVGLHNHL